MNDKNEMSEKLIEDALGYVEKNVGDWTHASDDVKAHFFADFAEKVAAKAVREERERTIAEVVKVRDDVAEQITAHDIFVAGHTTACTEIIDLLLEAE